MRHKALSLLLVGLLLVTGQSVAAQDREVGKSPWAEYTSPVLGLSFQYPADWTVEASNFEPALGRYGYTVTVTPGAADPSQVSKIEMVYQDYEIQEDQDLQTWVNGMVRTSPFFQIASGTPRSKTGDRNRCRPGTIGPPARTDDPAGPTNPKRFG